MANLGEKYLDRARRTVAETLILAEAARGGATRASLLARVQSFDAALDRDLFEDSLDRLLRDVRIVDESGTFLATIEGEREGSEARELFSRLASGSAPTPLA